MGKYKKTAKFIERKLAEKGITNAKVQGVTKPTVYAWLKGDSAPKRKKAVKALCEVISDTEKGQEEFKKELELVISSEGEIEGLDHLDGILQGRTKFKPALINSLFLPPNPKGEETQGSVPPIELFFLNLLSKVTYGTGILNGDEIEIERLPKNTAVKDVYKLEAFHIALPVLFTLDKFLYLKTYETPISLPINAVYSEAEYKQKTYCDLDLIKVAMLNREFCTISDKNITHREAEDNFNPIFVEGDVGEYHIRQYLGLKNGTRFEYEDAVTNVAEVSEELIKMTSGYEPLTIFVSDEMSCCELIKESEEDLRLLFSVNENKDYLSQGYSIFEKTYDKLSVPYDTEIEQMWYTLGMIASNKHGKWNQKIEELLEEFIRNNFQITARAYITLYRKLSIEFEGIVPQSRIKSWLNIGDENPRYENWKEILKVVKEAIQERDNSKGFRK